jgi:antitoxin (DNA-binding transcriptional repressor) of toxin-antitoxin stability system
MHTVDIQEAEKELSRLVDEAARGESFVISKEGKPLVKVEAVTSDSLPRRVGFMVGKISVPDDFDRMGEGEIAKMFGAEGEL